MMKLYFYHDKSEHQKLNSAGEDYTPAYIPLMLKNAGFTAGELTPEMLSSGVLSGGDIVVFGTDTLSPVCSASLRKAIEEGCTAIGFTTKADGVFPQNLPAISDDRYKTVGYFYFDGSAEPLPVFGSFGVMENAPRKCLGSIKDAANSEYAAFVSPSENVFFFTFDLAATLLYAADGKPTNEPIPPFPMGRIPDGCILENDYNFDIAFADSYMRAISDIITARWIPYIYPLPENNGHISDLALYFAGDDDAGSAENDMKASEAMFERHLPYHLNLMPTDAEGNFVITQEQFDTLHKRGCETAVHYNFLSFPYTPEGYRLQSDMYEQAFGEKSLGPVNHCLIQQGTAASRYRMQVDCGAMGDNNRFQGKPDPTDINAFNIKGFGFGSAFPRFVIDDAAHDNRELAFCEVYNSYYEPRIYKEDAEEYKKISDYLDEGFFYCRTLQLFTHPHYISGVVCDAAPALKALDFALEYVKEKNWNVYLSGPDALMRWWHDRAKCVIEQVNESGFTCINPTNSPMTLVLPSVIDTIIMNGSKCDAVSKTIAGKECLLITVGTGRFKISYGHQ